MAITTQTAAGANNLSQQAYDQGQQLQNMYNTQSTNAQNQYQQSYSGAQNAQSDLQNYTKQIANTNYGDVYGQDLSNAQNMYGFDPKSLLTANQALAHTQTTLANLPQAIQQQGNYYGTTAGAEAGNYSNLAGNLNTVQAGQSNAVNAFQNVLAATQQQANQQTTQQLNGQQVALGGFQSAATNAAQIQQNAGAVMNNIEQLQQQQGYLTAEQVAAYQNAYSTYVSAQAAATAAGGTAAQGYAQAGLANQQTLVSQQNQALAAQKAQQQAQNTSNKEYQAMLTGTQPKQSNSSSILSLFKNFA